MFSESDYDRLLLPITSSQTKLEVDIFSILIGKIKGIYRLSPTDLYMLFSYAYDVTELTKILDMIDKFVLNESKEIDLLLGQVAKTAYRSTKYMFDFKGTKYVPFEENGRISDIVRSISERTVGEFKNISKTTAFQVRQNGELMNTPLSRAYQTVVDNAIQNVLTGNIDYNKAIEQAIKEFSDSGLKAVTYNSEKGNFTTRRLDAAVKSNVLEGIRAINQGIQDEIGRQIGADGKEISVHQYPAADHAPIQGHQFTNEEYEKLQSDEDFEDVKGKHFNAIERAIGMWNCRHFTRSIILGLDKPLYTDKQLQDILDRNEEGYTTPSGKHLTMYQCTQVQRDYELKIKRAKEAYLLSKSVNNEELMSMYKYKVDTLNHEYQMFSNSCKIPPKFENTYVEGY